MSASADKILTQLQEDVRLKLLSEPDLDNVNIVLLQKLQTQNAADISMAWLNTRDGGTPGRGIIVGRCYLEDERTETGISDATINVPMWCFVQPDLCALDGGDKTTAEEIAIIARRILRGFIFEGIASLFTEGRSIEPAAVPEGLEDVDSVRLIVKGRSRQAAATRCERVSISVEDLTVTLSGGTAGATIYYTTDGTFPGPANSTARIYSEPFAVESGTVVRWAGYKTGLSGSHDFQRTINS